MRPINKPLVQWTLHKIAMLNAVLPKYSQKGHAVWYSKIRKPQGLHFKESRPYTWGDDARFIDWRATAKLQHTYTKLTEEEQGTDLYILAFLSPNWLAQNDDGTVQTLAAITAGLLARAAISTSDSVGCVVVNGSDVQVIKASNKAAQMQRIVEQLLQAPIATNSSTQESTFAVLKNIIPHGGKVACFYTNDFVRTPAAQRLLSKKYCLEWVQIHPFSTWKIPSFGLVQTVDVLTKKIRLEQILPFSSAWLGKLGGLAAKAGQTTKREHAITHTHEIMNVFQKLFHA